MENDEKIGTKLDEITAKVDLRMTEMQKDFATLIATPIAARVPRPPLAARVLGQEPVATCCSPCAHRC